MVWSNAKSRVSSRREPKLGQDRRKVRQRVSVLLLVAILLDSNISFVRVPHLTMLCLIDRFMGQCTCCVSCGKVMLCVYCLRKRCALMAGFGRIMADIVPILHVFVCLRHKRRETQQHKKRRGGEGGSLELGGETESAAP